MLQNFQQAEKTVGTSTIANNVTNQHQMPVTQPNPRTDTVKKGSLAEVLIIFCVSHVFEIQFRHLPFYTFFFFQKLLDRFDYDDEPEDMAVSEGNIQTQWVLRT